MTKPVSYKVMPSSNRFDVSYCTSFGSDNTPRKISGTVKKLKQVYKNALVVIFRKSDFKLLAIRKPDDNGKYIVNGLNKDVVCFVTAFDSTKKYNAVIQDEVTPK